MSPGVFTICNILWHSISDSTVTTVAITADSLTALATYTRILP